MEADVRVLIVDAHALFRQGLARLLDTEPGFRVVGQCVTVEEALKALSAVDANVVLLGFDPADRTAGEFLRLLPASKASCATLLITGVANEREIAQLLHRGASGVFCKNTDSSRLPGAIRQTLAGEIWVDQAYLKGLIAAAAKGLDESESPAPSSREREVLALVAQGLSNKQMADQLEYSEAAVKAALQRLFRKFGVGNRAQLLAVSAGLIQRVRTKTAGGSRASAARAGR